jgi:hypothetical protein
MKRKSNVISLFELKAKAKALWPNNLEYQKQWLRKTAQLAGAKKHVLDPRSKVQWRDYQVSR